MDYWKPRSFEKSLYEHIGVTTFQSIVMRNRKNSEGPTNQYIGPPSRRNAIEFSEWTKINEWYHLGVGALNTVLAAAAFTAGYFEPSSRTATYAFAAFNGALIMANAYCIFLQRYNRSRINDVLKRRELSDLA